MLWTTFLVVLAAPGPLLVRPTLLPVGEASQAVVVPRTSCVRAGNLRMLCRATSVKAVTTPLLFRLGPCRLPVEKGRLTIESGGRERSRCLNFGRCISWGTLCRIRAQILILGGRHKNVSYVSGACKSQDHHEALADLFDGLPPVSLLSDLFREDPGTITNIVVCVHLVVPALAVPHKFPGLTLHAALRLKA